METIAYTIGSTTTEIALGALGVGLNVKLEFGTHGESTCTLPLPALPPEISSAIPFEAQCVIRTGRTGNAGSYSGGTILFQGRRTDNSGHASASGASQQLVIEDAWYDLRFLTYQMLWRNITGYTGTTPNYGTSYIWPDSVLFQESFEGLLLPNGTFSGYPHGVYNYHVTTGDQIQDILAFAIYYGRVNLQIGQIDPSFFVPFYPVRSMRCADAIKICLRPHPDCTCEIDYTTTPPTLNIRQQSSLTPVTLPYKSVAVNVSSRQTHLTSDVKPLPELQPSRVGIYIKETSTVNGNSVVSVGADIYPLAAPTALRSLDVSLDMTGPKLSRTTATLTTAAFNPASLTWWAQKVPALQPQPNGQIPASGTGALALLDDTVNGGVTGHPKGIQVLDNSGNPVNPTQYGYELLTGTPASWMQLTGGGPVQWIEANVTAFFSYTKATIAGGSTINDQIGEHMHTCRVKLINTATATFANTQTLATGEIYPAGLAQYVYNSLATLQYDFTHQILESPFATLIKPGKHCLNLGGTGIPTAWTSMNAMIQGVTYELMFTPGVSGPTGTSTRTTVKCGPVKHLEAGELVQLFNFFTNRDLSKINPNERSTGQDQSGGQVTLGSDSPKENSAPAQSVPSEDNNVVVSSGVVTGQTIQSAPMVAAITTGKTPIGGGTSQGMITMQPREMAVCDNSGNFFYAAVQSTQGHTTP